VFVGNCSVEPSVTSIFPIVSWLREAAKDQVHATVTESVCTEAFFFVQEEIHDPLENRVWLVEEQAEDELRG